MGYGRLPQQVRSLEVTELHLSEMPMARRLVKDSLIVLGGTLFFLGLCATVGISTSTPPTSPTAEAAYEREHESEDLDLDRYPTRKLEDVRALPPADEPPSAPTYSGR